MQINVVCVDDSEDTGNLTVKMLRGMGPFAFRDGIEVRPSFEAVWAQSDPADPSRDLDTWARLIEAKNPGVAVIDMRLYGDAPDDTSGVDLALRVKSRHPDCCIILVSAHFAEIGTLVEFCDLEVLRDRVDRADKTPEQLRAELRSKVRAALATHATNVLYRLRKFSQSLSPSTGQMWALVLDSNVRGLRYRPDVPLPYLRANSVVVRLLSAGICGTNHGALGTAKSYPEFELIDIHEAFGEIVWTGESVRGLSTGNYVIPMVRRCHTWDKPAAETPVDVNSFDFLPCQRQLRDCFRHPDECPEVEYDSCRAKSRVGYKSRGTGKCHGFSSEYFVDTEDWLVKVDLPKDEALRTRDVRRCILAEPLSIVWKARREILKHRPIHECTDRVLIVGAGPIGILAGLVMRILHPGLSCTAVDLVPADNVRAEKMARLGIQYIQAEIGNGVPAAIRGEKFDVVIEATDQPQEVFACYSKSLESGGVFMMIGVPEGGANVGLAPDLFNDFVKNRNILIGSINSNRSDFEESVAFIQRVVSGAPPDIGEVLDDMILPIPADSDTGARLKRFGAEPPQARTFIKLVVVPPSEMRP